MITREQTIEVLNKITSNKPADFFKKIGSADKGLGFVLIYLSKSCSEVYASTISEKMNISRARVAVLLKKLESKNYIEKTSSAKDARIEIIKPTKKGLEKANELIEKTLSTTAKVIEEVGLDDINKFIEISSKIKKVIGDNQEE